MVIFLAAIMLFFIWCCPSVHVLILSSAVRCAIKSAMKDEVGITRPINGDESFPSCLGYTKKAKYDSTFRRVLDQNDTTLSGHTTVDGWRVLRYQKRVGYGKSCYRRVQNAVFDWEFESRNGNASLGIVSSALPSEKDVDVLATSTASPTTTKLLATFTGMRFPDPINSIFVVNPVHVVYEMRDLRQAPRSIVSSVAYATLSGHLLAGEERVTVRKGERDEVEVEILSFSRSTSSIVGKCIWPLIGRMQQQFFLSELYHLDKIAKY